MTLRIVPIGAGLIGPDRAGIFVNDLPGTLLQMVCDFLKNRARAIARAGVDAVVVASKDFIPLPLALAAKAGSAAMAQGRTGTARLRDKGSLMNLPSRSWSCITPGCGKAWWRAFCHRLKMRSDDGWLSIEHEEVMPNSFKRQARSAALPKGGMPAATAYSKPQEI